jgi:hypothetical protein
LIVIFGLADMFEMDWSWQFLLWATLVLVLAFTISWEESLKRLRDAPMYGSLLQNGEREDIAHDHLSLW